MANLDHGGQDGMVRMDYEQNFGLLLLRYSLINTSYIQIVIDLLLNLLSYASLAVILKKIVSAALKDIAWTVEAKDIKFGLEVPRGQGLASRTTSLPQAQPTIVNTLNSSRPRSFYYLHRQ